MNYKNILVCGYRATGKTTISRLLAQRLGMRFLDTDAMISKLTGKTISELTKQGTYWQDFRTIENNILKNSLQRVNCIISAGGGIGVNNHIDNKSDKTFGELNKSVIDNSPKTLTIVLTAELPVILSRIINQEKSKRHQRPILNQEIAKQLLKTENKDEHLQALIKDQENMYNLRKPLYDNLSKYQIDTGRSSIEQAVEQIIHITQS